MNLLVSSLVLIALSLSALTFLALENPNQELGEMQNSAMMFIKYLQRYNLHIINPQVYIYRLNIFAKNLQKIKNHNQISNKSYIEGINQFTLLTEEEFEQTYLTLQVPISQDYNTQEFLLDEIPSSIDWRDLNAVTPVKNQGYCGSSYAFSATGALEGIHKISGQDWKGFSEQQIIDCSRKQGNQGCNGGFMENVFDFAIQNGILQENEYPYEGHANFKCKKTNSNQQGYKIQGYYNVKKYDCRGLEQAVAQQPVSVAIDGKFLQRYHSGIIGDCGSNVKLNYGALIVGYTQDFFIVKNSWGTNWGEDGYFRITKTNTCGICEAASYPFQQIINE
ncbi:hypothetical protein ABPG74_015414 [Tetrahymena malaccensis]